MTFDIDKVGPLCVLIVSWTSDSSTGAVTGTSPKITGTLVKGQTIPSGTAVPSDNYDINITDESSIDVLTACQSNLTNRDTSNHEEAYFLVTNADGTPSASSAHPVVCDKLTVAITNAGNATKGTIRIYYIPGAKS
jgi:hypothetical protein